MKQKHLKLENTPIIIWGEPSEKVFLFVHGQGGCKEEAELFATIAQKYGWQVCSVDLPEHGERQEEKNCFDPWHAIPELQNVMNYIKAEWKRVALFGNSIGAWFSMQSFANENLEYALFVSPVLNMNDMVTNMMKWAGVTTERLEKEQRIETDFGQTLSWEYYTYIQEHPIKKWNIPTRILYGDKDNLVEMRTVDNFINQFGAKLQVMKDGEHWFHTPEQLKVLSDWATKIFENM